MINNMVLFATFLKLDINVAQFRFLGLIYLTMTGLDLIVNFGRCCRLLSNAAASNLSVYLKQYVKTPVIFWLL